MSKVFLFVEIDVKPGQKAVFLEKLAAHGVYIRTEEGCEALEIFTDTQNEDKVCVWEIWTNRPLWDAHMVNDASKAWQQVAPAFVNGEKITVMDSI
jgi:(4S)-4-hydroxy-5-phosphonooxypentane-2,3-dione isomerase